MTTLCFFLVSLLGGLRSQFYRFGSHFRVNFTIILNIFSLMLQNPKNTIVSSEILGLGGVGPLFLHLFRLLFNVFFMLLSRQTFCLILAHLGFPREVRVGVHVDSFCKFNVLKLRFEN